MYFYRGMIYLDYAMMAAMDEEIKNDLESIGEEKLNDAAFGSLKKCIEMDVKNQWKGDITRKLDGLRGMSINGGVQLFQNGDYKNSFEAFKAAVMMYDVLSIPDTLAMINAALAAEKMKSFNDAYTYYKMCADNNYGKGAEMYQSMIRVLNSPENQNKDDEKILSVIEEGKQRFPKDFVLNVEEFNFWYAKGDNDKAQQALQKAIEADPNYARAHAWKTCSLANNAEWFQEEMPDGWMDEAFASVNKAMELDPNDPEAHRIMGAIKLLFEGDMEKAIFHHEKAIEICPSDTYHISRYAVLLCYLGQPEKGLAQIERALRLDPFCSDLVLETQGLCHYLLGQHKEALSTFKKMQIETRTSLFYCAACNKALGNDDIAKQMLKMAMSESEMTSEKFVSTQLFQDKQTSEELAKVLNSI